MGTKRFVRGAVAALGLTGALLSTQAFGDGPISSGLRDEPSLQCTSGIAERGDAKDAVQDKCGKPTSVEQGGEVWVYDFGPGRFVYYLTFLEGRLNRIQSGGYGRVR